MTLWHFYRPLTARIRPNHLRPIELQLVVGSYFIKYPGRGEAAKARWAAAKKVDKSRLYFWRSAAPDRRAVSLIPRSVLFWFPPTSFLWYPVSRMNLFPSEGAPYENFGMTRVVDDRERALASGMPRCRSSRRS